MTTTQETTLTPAQSAVLRMLTTPRTDAEIADEWGRMAARTGLPNYSGSRLRTARNELMKAHLVIDTGDRRPTGFGRLAAVWALKGPRHLGRIGELNMIRESRAQVGVRHGERRGTPAKHRAVS